MDNNQTLSTQIVYFSGTGGTQRVATTFKDSLETRGFITYLTALDLSLKQDEDNFQVKENVEWVFLIFALHAFDAPQPVYNWINHLTMQKKKKVVVLSVSGGGEVWPNTGCRNQVNQVLQDKGFKVVYEKMMCMPCNWVTPMNDHMAMQLLVHLPEKVGKILDSVLSGKIRRTSHRKGMFPNQITKSEKKLSKQFPTYIHINDQCVGCGWCARSCPTKNIEMAEGKPVFKETCVMCYRCIYGCPKKAMTSNHWMVIKEGFSIEAIEKRMQGVKLEPVEKCCKGLLWSGVKNYLKDQEQ